MSSAGQEITGLLLAWGKGDQQAFDQLVPVVYDELRRIARRYIERESAGHPLQATALVHEAYIRLIDASKVQWQNRAHFFGVSANMMRRILVDYARSHNILKRGGRAQHFSLEGDAILSPERAPDLVALDEALDRLAAVDTRKSRVVELRFFGGLTVEETGEVLKLSARTVQLDWSFAKSWLLRELTTGDHHADASG
ncbi:MAG TPA: sigma-70 family RNA polymerase sigma factor [Candidatus Acidoferrum sp.]|jgi:RNA polymerase sigma-70 factor (ECF subfamily)|nr:sigma-70 family RNA polymerase sigma factor [Candidatus Acidoferrum sp.]